MSWLALTIDVHWQQVRGETPPQSSIRRFLSLAGAAALTLSLSMCFLADHPSMAPLVWVMELGVSALLIGVVLPWCPRVLTIIVPGRSR